MKIHYVRRPAEETAPYVGVITRRRNPVWGGIALGPFGLFYWIRRDYR